MEILKQEFGPGYTLKKLLIKFVAELGELGDNESSSC
jgi:ubiquitin-protein ligase